MCTRASISTASALAFSRLIARCRWMPSTICAPTVKAGLSDVIGSWKIMAMRSPRRLRSAAGDRRNRSVPSNRISPPAMRPGGCGTRPMIDSAVTLLPHPDSPTIPSVRPVSSDRLMPSTAGNSPPPSTENKVLRLRISSNTLTSSPAEGWNSVRPHWAHARNAPTACRPPPALADALFEPWLCPARAGVLWAALRRSSMPTRRGGGVEAFDFRLDLRAIGHARRPGTRWQAGDEGLVALEALDIQPQQFSKRLGVIVNAQIQERIRLRGTNQERCRLLAALVPPCGFACHDRRDQAFGEGQVVAGIVGLRRILDDLRPHQHVARDRVAVARDLPAPLDALGAGMRGDVAFGVDDMQLPMLAATIGFDQRIHDVRRRQALRQH